MSLLNCDPITVIANSSAGRRPTSRRVLLVAYFTTVVLVVMAAATRVAHAADRFTPPSVHEIIEVPAGHKLVLVGHAVGTQNYICAPAPTLTGADWLFIGPQATPFDGDMQIATHFHRKRSPTWR